MFQEAHRGPVKTKTGQSSTNYENVPGHLCYLDYQATFLLKPNERDFTAITFIIILTLFIPMDQRLIFSLNSSRDVTELCGVTTLTPEQFDHSNPKPTSRRSAPPAQPPLAPSSWQSQIYFLTMTCQFQTSNLHGTTQCADAGQVFSVWGVLKCTVLYFATCVRNTPDRVLEGQGPFSLACTWYCEGGGLDSAFS